MDKICTGACIFGKCEFDECIKYQSKNKDAIFLNKNLQILTDNYISKIKSKKSGFGIAVDIGTTTVVAYLYDLKNSECIGVKSSINSQVSLGVDVISRIKFCSD